MDQERSRHPTEGHSRKQPLKFQTECNTTLASYDAAIEWLKSRYGVQRIELIGYSGGGVLATLLAGRRHDVERLITVAAPLAVAEWTKLHNISPLEGSLDPLSGTEVLPLAIHFVGGRDTVVPPAVVEHFASLRGGRVISVPEFDHECCWSRDWQRLMEEIR